MTTSSIYDYDYLSMMNACRLGLALVLVLEELRLRLLFNVTGPVRSCGKTIASRQ